MTKPCPSTNDSSLLGSPGAWMPGRAILRVGSDARPARGLILALAWTLPLTLLAAVALLAWRRWAGALVQPPQAAVVLAAGLGAACLGAAVRVGSLLASADRWGRLAFWLPLPALAVFGWALSVPGASPTVLVALWAVLVIEEATGIAAAGWFSRRAASRQPVPEPLGPVPDVETLSPSHAPEANPALSTEESTAVAEMPDSAPSLQDSNASPVELACPEAASIDLQSAPDVVQQLTRSQAGDRDVLSGWLRLEFAPGQRNAAAHVAFCPPFARLPLVEVAQLDGPSGRIKTAQVLPFGVRLEVKLGAVPDSAVQCVVRFTAACAGS